MNVGFVYRSAFTLNLRGQFLVNGAVAANTVIPFNMPQAFTGAIALWPVRDQDHEWKLELNLDYTDRHSFVNTDVHRSTAGTPPWSGPSTNGLRPEKLPHWGFAIRGGYFYGQNPVPDAGGGCQQSLGVSRAGPAV